MSERVDAFGHMEGRAMTLNPAAGWHPVTSDLQEVAAATRAGDRSFREFPYFEARYGGRGRLFALSDGAWLVTLCSNPDTEAVTAEVEWLAQVLSSRGMPSLLLERHLAFMEEELTSAVPARAAEYRKLGVAREALEARRKRMIPDAELHHIVADFDAATDAATAEGLPRMGLVLVAAVADEAAGVDRAAKAVLEWAADPARFSERWVRAVVDTVSTAREAVKVDFSSGSGQR